MHRLLLGRHRGTLGAVGTDFGGGRHRLLETRNRLLLIDGANYTNHETGANALSHDHVLSRLCPAQSLSLSEAMCHTKYGTPATNGASKKQKTMPRLPGQTMLTWGVGIARPDTPAVVLPPPSRHDKVPMEVEAPRSQKGDPAVKQGTITEVRVKLNLRFAACLSGVVASLTTHVEVFALNTCCDKILDRNIIDILEYILEYKRYLVEYIF